MVACIDHRENLRRLREKLARTTDEEECRRIVRLIEAEEVKGSLQTRKRCKTTVTGIIRSGVRTCGSTTLSATRERRTIGVARGIHRRRSAPANLI